jgi:hypothetical protein
MSLAPVATIDAATVTPEEFRRRHFDTSTPVLLSGFLRTWPACTAWTPANFAKRFGGEQVDVMHTAPGAPDSESGPYRGVHATTMGAFVATLEDARGGDLYMVAQNQLLRRPAFASLWDDLALDSRWFDIRKRHTHISLWMGPRGAVTPLHFDLQHALVLQVFGHKRVLLAAPADTACLYQGDNGYARVNPEQPDLDLFPQFSQARLFETTIAPGAALFLPLGWWHHVRSLTHTISLSVSNFAWA